jgi:hypothetical protein
VHFGKTRGFSKDRKMPSRFIPVAHFANAAPRTLGPASVSSARMESFDGYREPGDPAYHSRSGTFIGDDGRPHRS